MNVVFSICLSLFLFFSEFSDAQNAEPVVSFERSDITAGDSAHLMSAYGNNKEFIPQFTLQTLIALSYFPELKETHIRFIYRHANSLFTTRPVFPCLLSNGKKRTFTITISDSSIDKLQPLLIERMDFNTQIGIIGHELSHVSDFSKRSVTSLIGSGIGHVFSTHYIDRFEFRTDSVCIAHGLGYQLLSWSTFVRRTMHTANWEGADNVNEPMTHERYMNPSTIRQHIAANPLYSKNAIK